MIQTTPHTRRQLRCLNLNHSIDNSVPSSSSSLFPFLVVAIGWVFLYRMVFTPMRSALASLAAHPLFHFLLVGLWVPSGVSAMNVFKPLDLGFFFDYNRKNEPVPIPISIQCEILHIRWERGAATGPNPAAPYSLLVYTSAYTVPFVIDAGRSLNFDWAVPFAPGTQYQICMFDKFGNTGGCQAMYTVVQNATDPFPGCQNVTLPETLDVVGEIENGSMSRFGFINQCSDVSLTPKGGTPPFVMTIAPALHPPFRIRSESLAAINWTVSLTWASPFFLSLSDSTGKQWAKGPMHVGGPGTSGCFDIAETTALRKSLAASRSSTAGVGVGGLFGGLILGVVTCFFFLRSMAARKMNSVIDPSTMEKEGPFESRSRQWINSLSDLTSVTVPQSHRPVSRLSQMVLQPNRFPLSDISSVAPSDSVSRAQTVRRGAAPYPVPGVPHLAASNARRVLSREAAASPVNIRAAPSHTATTSTASVNTSGRLFRLHRDATGNYSSQDSNVIHIDEVEELPPMYNGDGNSGPGNHTAQAL